MTGLPNGITTALGSCAECEETVLAGDECPECYEERATLRHDRCCPFRDLPPNPEDDYR